MVTLAEVETMTPEQARDALAAVAAATLLLLAKALEAGKIDDRLVDALEASRRLSLSRSYIFDNADSFPFTVRVGNRVLFSASGIQKFIRTRQGGKR